MFYTQYVGVFLDKTVILSQTRQENRYPFRVADELSTLVYVYIFQ